MLQEQGASACILLVVDLATGKATFQRLERGARTGLVACAHDHPDHQRDDEMMGFQNNFYAIVKERGTDTKAFEVLIDRNSGTVFPEYGPNMMWNTKYGMMRAHYDPKPMTLTPEQATQSAAQWLAQNQPGATTETPDRFYGYYTLHIIKGGTVTGMLSVNGATGQVWYHNWHGDSIQMKEAGA